MMPLILLKSSFFSRHCTNSRVVYSASPITPTSKQAFFIVSSGSIARCGPPTIILIPGFLDFRALAKSTEPSKVAVSTEIKVFLVSFFQCPLVSVQMLNLECLHQEFRHLCCFPLKQQLYSRFPAAVTCLLQQHKLHNFF